MSVNDGIGACTFDTIAFPYVERTVTLETRTHEHEFWQMPGAKIEKGGRKVYTFSFTCEFHATLAKYPDLYPGTLNAFVKRSEDQTTAPLFIPEIGTIRALLTRVERVRKGRIRSGESVTLHFVEDDEQPFNAVAVPTVAQDVIPLSIVVIVHYEQLSGDEKAQIETDSKPRHGLFDSLDDLCQSLKAIKDQPTLYGNLISAKLEKIVSLCHIIHETVKFVRHPRNEALARSIRNLSVACSKLLRDLHQTGRTTRPYTVPRRMSLLEASVATYGDATHGGELLSLNRGKFQDPFAIKAGTVIQYYAAAA